MLAQVAGDSVILMYQDCVKCAFVTVPQHLLILCAVGCLAGNGFVCIDPNNIDIVLCGVLLTGSYLRFYAVLCLFVRTVAGIYNSVHCYSFQLPLRGLFLLFKFSYTREITGFVKLQE